MEHPTKNKCSDVSNTAQHLATAMSVTEDAAEASSSTVSTMNNDKKAAMLLNAIARVFVSGAIQA